MDSKQGLRDVYEFLLPRLHMMPQISGCEGVAERRIKVSLQLLNAFEAIEPYNDPIDPNSEMAPTKVVEVVEGLLDYLYSDRGKMSVCACLDIYSEDNIDFCVNTLEWDDTPASQTIEVFSRLLNYQVRTGGQALLDGYNKTIPFCEKLYFHFVKSMERSECCNDGVKECFYQAYAAFITQSSKLYCQLGQKKSLADVVTYCTRETDLEGYSFLRPPKVLRRCDDKESDAKIWQFYSEKYSLPLACAACGNIEKEGKSGHKWCGGCSNTVYCSKKCQRAFWPLHKKECKEISERNKKMICRDCGGTIKDRNEACGGEERGLETRKVLEDP